MRWKPGQPVITSSDNADWLAWRKARKLEQQRERRHRHPRIDYYPCKVALDLIRSRTHGQIGGDYSSVIDAMVLEVFRNKKQKNFRC